MFEDLKAVIDLINNNIHDKYSYEINIKTLYLSLRNDVVGWFNPIITLSNRGYRYVYEYEKTDLRQINTRQTIKQQLLFPGKVYIYNIIDGAFEYVELYKTCLQTLFITNNDRQYNTFHYEFARINNQRICDSLVLRINDIRKILDYVLFKRNELLPILLNIKEDFKKEYIRENVGFKKIYLNTALLKTSETNNVTEKEVLQNEMQVHAIYEIAINIDNNLYNRLSKTLQKTDIVYFSNYNELHERCIVPKNKTSEFLSYFFNSNIIKQFKQQYKNVSYNLFLVTNTVTDKKQVVLQINLPMNKSIFTDALVYISMPNLKYI